MPLTQIPLMQQRIATLIDTLEQSMKIEAMAGYPRRLRVTRPPENVNLAQLQGKNIGAYRKYSRAYDT